MQNVELIIKEGTPATVGDLSLTLSAGGHRITEAGDRNLASLTLEVPNLEKLEIPLRADGNNQLNQKVEFGQHQIQLISLTDDGQAVTLLISKSTT